MNFLFEIEIFATTNKIALITQLHKPTNKHKHMNKCMHTEEEWLCRCHHFHQLQQSIVFLVTANAAAQRFHICERFFFLFLRNIVVAIWPLVVDVAIVGFPYSYASLLLYLYFALYVYTIDMPHLINTSYRFSSLSILPLAIFHHSPVCHTTSDFHFQCTNNLLTSQVCHCSSSFQEVLRFHTENIGKQQERLFILFALKKHRGKQVKKIIQLIH